MIFSITVKSYNIPTSYTMTKHMNVFIEKENRRN